jgi:hypothetical protein
MIVVSKLELIRSEDGSEPVQALRETQDLIGALDVGDDGTRLSDGEELARHRDDHVTDAQRMGEVRNRPDAVYPIGYLGTGNLEAVTVQDAAHLGCRETEERIADEGIAPETEHLDFGVAQRGNCGKRAFEVFPQQIAYGEELKAESGLNAPGKGSRFRHGARR